MSKPEIVWVQNLKGFVNGTFPADEHWKRIFVERLDRLSVEEIIERVENCVLFSTPAEYAGLADHAAFEAGQDNAIANVLKTLRADLKETQE